jgi:hypothetical protein
MNCACARRNCCNVPATTIMINCPTLLNNLAYGQILNWRLNGYIKIEEMAKYTSDDMFRLMDISISESDDDKLFIDFINQVNQEADVSIRVQKQINVSSDSWYDSEDEIEDVDMEATTDIEDEDMEVDPIQHYASSEYVDAFIADLTTTPIKPSDVVFIKYDSSLIAKHEFKTSLANGLQDLKKKGVVKDSTILVFVADVISYIESRYKLVGKNFVGDDMEQVRNNSKTYMKIFESDDLVRNFGFNYCYRFSVTETNQIMVDLEREAMHRAKASNFRIRMNRNEINDDTQLEILKSLRQKYPGSKSVMFTNDKGLQRKCKKEDIRYFSMM